MKRILTVAVGLLMVAGMAAVEATAEQPATTPAPLVDAYDSLADTILGAKQTEWNLVHAILAMTYQHAEGTYRTALAKLRRGEEAGDEIEMLAELVSQLANEGDAAVAAVRKRLLEGGHHHHAAGEAQGKYEEGFVIVPRAAKKSLLDSARAIGRLARAADAEKLQGEWEAVEREFGKLHQGTAAGH